jgi:aspartyl-tRNA synthetase
MATRVLALRAGMLARRAPRVLPAVRYSSTAAPATPSKIKPFKPAFKLRAHHGERPRPTHEVDALGPAVVGERAVLAGWLYAARRAREGLYFFTLRSAAGSVQLVVRDETRGQAMMDWPLESVVQVSGEVVERKAKAKDAASPADQVEVDVSDALLLNPADNLPFYPNRPPLANEDLRAQHRYLDLRRAELASNLRTRSRVAHIVRNYLHDNGFTEVETPVLLNSSPEGAREFLVPTRVSAGSPPAFYALPQSPQQPKQLLVASGAVPRYYQIAKCFRDEDGRKDRQPEFTQIDLEMAFVDGSAPPMTTAPAPGSAPWMIGGAQVRDIAEGMVKNIWKGIKGVDLGDAPFRVIPYEVAMDVYGSDKPDTRYEMYTLPIGYYPTLSDASLDKILMDENQSTVEWMVTPAQFANAMDVKTLAGDSQFVSSQVFEASLMTVLM